MLLQVILEGLGPGALLVLVCAVGICWFWRLAWFSRERRHISEYSNMVRADDEGNLSFP